MVYLRVPSPKRIFVFLIDQDRSAARHQRQNNRARHLHAVHRSEVEPLDTDRVELESADAPRPEVSREQPGAASIAAAIRPLKVLD
jgi:hypothetical protein